MKRSEAEKVRRELLRRGLLNLELKVKTIDGSVLLPLKIEGDRTSLENVGVIITDDLELVERPPRTYKDLLNLDGDLQEMLPSSFDVIGDICIIKLPDPLLPYRDRIGNALMETKRNLRTVALDMGVRGQFRIRDLEVISGSDDLETVHVENNLRFRLDPGKVYFSPRLASERMRIAQLTENGRILDMFAGVGPFSLTIARHGDPEEVIGIDLNPDCVEFFKNNIRLNSLEDTVDVFLGDAREAPQGMGPFDRIIMNLPHGAKDYLDVALDLMEEGMIHLYSIVDEGKILEHIRSIMDVGRSIGKDLETAGVREVHNYSPSQSMMAFDIKIRS